ncbi:MAG: hypothetical protein R6W91_03060 [Thermoplasmata archaeon]
MKTTATILIASLLALTILSGMAMAGKCAPISTEKEIYISGEDVRITVTNQLSEPAVISWYWVEDSNGQCVYTQRLTLFPEYLAPGESYEFVWTQVDDNGNLVPVGVYTIRYEQADTQITISEGDATSGLEQAGHNNGRIDSNQDFIPGPPMPVLNSRKSF